MIELRRTDCQGFLDAAVEWFQDKTFTDGFPDIPWSRDRVRGYFDSLESSNRFAWSLWSREAPIGLGFVDDWDEFHGNCSIHVRVRPGAALGAGLVAAVVLADWAFRWLPGLHKVYTRRKQPFRHESRMWTFEGVERDRFKNGDGTYRNVFRYGILKDEFYENRIVRRILHLTPAQDSLTLTATWGVAR